jgi:IclR family pca regulon transcriptional regulator
MNKPERRAVKRSLLRTANLSAKAPADEFKKYQGDPDFVLSLARGLRVIESFERHTEGLSISDVARAAGFSRSAVRRLLITLELLGYAETNGRIYKLKTPILKLGLSYLSSASLPSIAQPILERMTEAVHESSSVSVLEGDQIVYVARAAAKRVMSVGLSVGSRLPAYCTSMGRVLLAGLPESELAIYLRRLKLEPLTPKTVTDKMKLSQILSDVKSTGFSVTDEELELGLRSIAVPIRSRQNRVVAAMNIGVHAARVSTEDMPKRFLPMLLENAQILCDILP